MNIMVIVTDDNGYADTFNLPGVSPEKIESLSFGHWKDGELKLVIKWKSSDVVRTQ